MPESGGTLGRWGRSQQARGRAALQGKWEEVVGQVQGGCGATRKDQGEAQTQQQTPGREAAGGP